MTPTTTASGATFAIGTPRASATSVTLRRTSRAGFRSTVARGAGAALLAIGIGASLAACGPAGSGAEGGATTAPPATAPVTPGETADTSQCGDVRATLATVEERLRALPDKIPGDIPGAIDDVQTSVTELQAQRGELRDGELKTHVDNVIARGNEALEILNQAQSGEITVVEATVQGAAKVTELFADLEALKAYCSIE